MCVMLSCDGSFYHQRNLKKIIRIHYFGTNCVWNKQEYLNKENIKPSSDNVVSLAQLFYFMKRTVKSDKVCDVCRFRPHASIYQV
jgi:hypothetical protein